MSSFSLAETLQMKEAEEINNWSRLVAQIFFSWYTVFLTLNGAALTWALGHDTSAQQGHSKMWYGMLLLLMWSIMGVIVTIPVIAHVVRAKRRLAEIYSSLLGRNHGKVKVSIPTTTAILSYSMAMCAMVALALIWRHLLRTTP
jgi:hypothetical protein